MKKQADAREIALDRLDSVLGQRRSLDDESWSPLEGRDRAFARQLVATTLRRLGQIDACIAACVQQTPKTLRVRNALRLGACQLLFLGTPPHAAISTSVALLKGGPLTGFTGLVNAVLRRLDREGADLLAAQDAAVLNTPEWMWESWVAAWGEDGARAIAAAHLIEPPTDFSVKGDPAAWTQPLEAELLPTGSLRRHGAADIAALPGYAEGAWWVQDAAAALPVLLMGDVRGQRVADLCAAPGGKTLQLAAAGALVTAVDRSDKRLDRLRQNLDRMALAATVIAADLRVWRPETPFDAVLLDAPCSATGTLRRHPDGLHLKKPGDVVSLSEAQGALLNAAAAMVRPGGLLLYSVCSLETVEGEDQVAAFLTQDGSFVREAVRAEEIGGLAQAITPGGDLRTLPCHWADRGGLDGFFAARLRKIGEPVASAAGFG